MSKFLFIILSLTLDIRIVYGLELNYSTDFVHNKWLTRKWAREQNSTENTSKEDEIILSVRKREWELERWSLLQSPLFPYDIWLYYYYYFIFRQINSDIIKLGNSTRITRCNRRCSIWSNQLANEHEWNNYNSVINVIWVSV